MLLASAVVSVPTALAEGRRGVSCCSAMVAGAFFFLVFGPFLLAPVELSDAVPLELMELFLTLRLAGLASLVASDTVVPVDVLVEVSSAESGLGMVGPSRGPEMLRLSRRSW